MAKGRGCNSLRPFYTNPTHFDDIPSWDSTNVTICRRSGLLDMSQDASNTCMSIGKCARIYQLACFCPEICKRVSIILPISNCDKLCLDCKTENSGVGLGLQFIG